MTEVRCKKDINASLQKLRDVLVGAIMLFVMLLLSLVLSDEIGTLVNRGLRIAVGFVIPSAFPFMILSDLYAAYGYPERITPLYKALNWLLGIPKVGIRAYVSGNLSGFPIGAKAVSELYRRGELDRGAAQRLLILSSSPSPAFVFGAVAHGMLKDDKAGYIILSALLISQIIFASFTRQKGGLSQNRVLIARQTFSMLSSVRSAGYNCIAISSFVVFFSCLVGAVENLLPIPTLIAILSALCEVTGGVSYFATNASFAPSIKYGAICFCLGFGGLSVMLQSTVFFEDTDLSLSSFFISKLINGIIAFGVGTILALIFVKA